MSGLGQSSFLPVVCNRTKPAPATADADFIAIDDQTTERYLCKGQVRSAHLPATEWICSRLARDCGLPVPPFAVVELLGAPGVHYFGSQWQGGALEFSAAFHRISNPEIFGQTLGTDLFLHNVDRHLGNYLYLELAGEVVARVIDFSRALLHNGWPLPTLPLAADSNTMKALPYWMQQYGSAYAKPTALLDRVAALPSEWMPLTLAEMPDAWLDASAQTDLRSWWTSNAREARADSAKSNLP